MVTLSSTKEARIYNGKKIASLASGAGKIGQPLVKEWNYGTRDQFCGKQFFCGPGAGGMVSGWSKRIRFRFIVHCISDLMLPLIWQEVLIYSPEVGDPPLRQKETLLLLLSRFSRVRLRATPQTAAHQAPPSVGFFRQDHWSGLPLPSPKRAFGW